MSAGESVRPRLMLSGVTPTEKHVKLPNVVVTKFKDGKIAGEHIYWDQANALGAGWSPQPDKLYRIRASDSTADENTADDATRQIAAE